MTDQRITKVVIARGGPPGPSGPTGPAGPAGPAGGPAGPTGATGPSSDFPWRSTRWYGPTAHARGAVGPSSVSAVMATVANRYARFAPFYVTSDCAISQVRFAVATAATGGSISVSLYTVSTALTAFTRIADLGTVAATVADLKTITPAANISLTGGVWYAAALIGEATAEGLQVAGRQSETGIYGVDDGGFPCSGRFAISGVTTIAPPTTWSVVTAITTFVPRIELLVV